MILWVQAAVRSWVQPGSAGEIHSTVAGRGGDDLAVHAEAAVLGRVVRAGVADTVAFGEGAV